MMPTSLLVVPWAASIILVGALGFRVGVWWRTTRVFGRHSMDRFRHGDDQAAAPWGRAAADDDEDYGANPDDDRDNDVAADMHLPPAKPQAMRWWRDDEDTEVLPRVQDIRPHTRARAPSK